MPLVAVLEAFFISVGGGLDRKLFHIIRRDTL